MLQERVIDKPFEHQEKVIEEAAAKGMVELEVMDNADPHLMASLDEIVSVEKQDSMVLMECEEA